jgi:hypothetical protein
VDIDPSAIDVAKLRLWLSLVVDEDNITDIDPLPNLDYKIVCGNSLLGYGYRPGGLDEIENLKNQYFDETNNIEKRKLKQKIDIAIEKQFAGAEKALGYKLSFDFQINFSEIWHNRNGFDIVIGNPPYGGDLEEKHKILFKSIYKDVHTRTPDTLNYFISKSLKILPVGGVLSFIVSNNLLYQNEYVKTRQLFAQNDICIVVNLGDSVFENAIVPSCIFVIQRSPSKDGVYRYADLRNVEKSDINFCNIQFIVNRIDLQKNTQSYVFARFTRVCRYTFKCSR